MLQAIDDLGISTTLCADLTAGKKMVDAFVEIGPQFGAAVQNARTKAMNTADQSEFTSVNAMTLWGLVEAVMQGMGLLMVHANRCSEDGLDNRNQLFSGWSPLDAANHTKQQVLTNTQACCACGGGTTRWKGPDPNVTSVLNDLYVGTNGAQWADSYGWQTEASFCTWVSRARCKDAP